jgi:hypothetical protein
MVSIPWAAGIIEGEGCFEISKKDRNCRITVAMTDLDILERLQQLFGGTIISLKRYEEHHKPCWKWRVGKREAVTEAIEKMLPWLGLRRTYQALNVLDHYDNI